jgi:hypothetical protein
VSLSCVSRIIVVSVALVGVCYAAHADNNKNSNPPNRGQARPQQMARPQMLPQNRVGTQGRVMGARPAVGMYPGRRSFRGRDFHSFSPAERAHWAGGRWHNEWHAGRIGWWWEVDGVWYLYAAPIYPYPDFVAVVADDGPAGTDGSYGTIAAPMGQAPAASWYFCDASQSYYPYVSSCPGGWRAVSATPPQ